MRVLRLLAALVLSAWVGAASPVAAADRVKVVASLQPLYSILAALSQGTTIDPKAVPAALQGSAQLPRALSRLNAANAAELESADAVVTIASIWPDDPVFREARARNIRVVHIDAARSLAKGGASVMLAASPGSNAPWRRIAGDGRDSPYVWFSLANAIRMAEIIATDLKRLAPSDEGRIETNLKSFSADLQAMRAEFDAKFLSIDDPRMFSLTDRFVYLTNEFGLDLSGYFLEEDVRWTKDDLEKFSAFLSERGISRVLHHWQPSDEIVAAIGKAGAQLVILDDIDGSGSSAPTKPDAGRYQALLRADLEALHRALSSP